MNVKYFVKRGFNKILTFSACYDEYWGGVVKFWNLNKFDYDVANLGSNSGKFAFDYSEVSCSGVNFAVGPQSIVHDFNILKNYFSYLRPGAKVLIPLCFFSSLLVTYTKVQNFKYYTILHPATIENFDDEERTRAFTAKLYPQKNLKLLVKYALHYYYGKIKALLKGCNYKKNAAGMVASWKKQFGIDDLNAPLQERFVPQQESRAITLREMIDFCLERDLKPFLVLPPIHKELSNLLSAQCRDTYLYSFIKKANVQNIPLLDYTDSHEFQKNCYFKTAYFMNKKGARIFTKRVLDDIKSRS